MQITEILKSVVFLHRIKPLPEGEHCSMLCLLPLAWLPVIVSQPGLAA